MNIKHGSALALAALTLAACTPQSREEYSQAGNQAAQAMKRDADTATRAAQAANQAAKESIRNSSEHPSPNPPNGPASTAIDNVPNAVQTPKVKAALMEAKGLDTSNLDVETVGRQVFLKGSVPSGQQKQQAVQIAKNTVSGGYQVVDQLSVH